MNSPRRLTASLAALLLVLTLAASAWLAWRPPASPTPAPTLPVTYAPTVAPPTDLPFPTDTPATPEGFYATQQAGEQATTIARATTSPFPTAAPAAIQSGQPTSLTVRRGGLSLQVRLPKSTYVSGEAGLADSALTNDGPEPLFVYGDDSPFFTTLLDTQGREPPAWPWAPLSYPRPPYLQSLGPGQSLTGTLVFHVVGPAPSYSFWVGTRFSRASPLNPEGPDNIWLRLEAGPIPLTVLEPGSGPQLLADLHADVNGWSLRVTDLSGHTPAGPFSGSVEASGSGSLAIQPLPGDTGGVWSGTWDNNLFSAGPFAVRAWVGAPGYVSAIARQTVGPGAVSTFFDTALAPRSQTFDTLPAAQAALGIPLYRLGAAPTGASLDSIRAEDSVSGGLSSDGRSVTTHQFYRLASGAWLEFDQLYYSPPYEMGNWGQARYDGEAQAITMSGQLVYLMQSLGWWTLDWKMGNDGFELRAPVSAISAENLIAAAGGVKP